MTCGVCVWLRCCLRRMPGSGVAELCVAELAWFTAAAHLFLHACLKMLRPEHFQGALTAVDRAHARRLGTRRAAAVAARGPPGPASARAWRPAPPPAACRRRATARAAQPAQPGHSAWVPCLGRVRVCRRPSALGWVRVASGGACKWCLDRSRTALQAAAPPRSAAPHARARAPSGARRRRAPPSSPCSVRMHLERAAACPAGELRAHALRSDPGRGGEAAGPQYTVQQHLLLQRAGACPKAQGTGCTGGVARQGGAALARETSACAAATGRGRAAACMPGHCLCAGLGEQASHALP